MSCSKIIIIHLLQNYKKLCITLYSLLPATREYATLYWLQFFLCPVTAISVTVTAISMKFCMMAHISPKQIYSLLGGGIPWDPQIRNFGHLTMNISKMVSRSITCQLELNISSTRAFWKCKAQGGSPPPSGVHPSMAGLGLADTLGKMYSCALICRILHCWLSVITV